MRHTGIWAPRAFTTKLIDGSGDIGITKPSRMGDMVVITVGKVDKMDKSSVELSKMVEDKLARETNSMIETSGVALLATPMGKANGDPNLIAAEPASDEGMVHMVRIILATSGPDPHLLVTSNDQEMLSTEEARSAALHITKVAETTHEDGLKRNLGGKRCRSRQITKIGGIIHTTAVTRIGVDPTACNKVVEDRAIEQPQALESLSFTASQFLSNELSTTESVDTDAFSAGFNVGSGGGSISDEHGDIDQKGFNKRKRKGKKSDESQIYEKPTRRPTTQILYHRT